MTSVPVNRILKEFRESGLIAIRQRTITLLNLDELQAIAGFNKSYLHLGGAPPEIARYFDNLEKGQASQSSTRAGR